MTGQDATAQIYELKKLQPSKEDYESVVRNALLDYEVRLKDVGDEERLQFLQAEVTRLDEKFNIMVQ